MKFYHLTRVVLVALWISFTIQVIAQDTSDGVTIHVIQRGENLFRIAQQYGVTIDDLARLNGITNPGNVNVGQRLLVPNEVIPQPTPPPTHTVRPGDTLRTITLFYDLTIEDIIAFNQLGNPNTIYAGQVLQLAPQLATPVSEQASGLPQNEIISADEPPQRLIHPVRRGETLFQIARQYDLTVNEMVKANNIEDPTRIYVGQQLIVPGLEPAQLALDLPAPYSSLQVAPQVLVEGKTMRVRITTGVPVTISGSFLGQNLNIAAEEDQTYHTVLQGIPLFTEAGIYPLTLVATDVNTGVTSSFEFNLEVIAGPYGREQINLLAGRDGLLDPAVEESELNILRSVMAPLTKPRHFDGPMGLPAAATIISPYGTRRSYNNGPFDRSHSGTDFAGAPGTPVLATAPGRVVLADILNVRGLATVIDHGWGIYTGYWHQAQQNVQVGEFVTSGQVIGTIGATGRVTGAHLHWELWVGSVAVDPMQWVRLSFN